MGLQITRTALNFQSPGTLAPYTETVTGGLAPYTAASSDAYVATVAQGTSPNLYPNSDTLSGSTLSGLTQASGGPGGATDAELLGTGGNANNQFLSLLVPVTMGDTYTPSWWIDPSAVSNNTGSQIIMALRDINANGAIASYVPSGASTATRYSPGSWMCPINLVPHSDDLSTSSWAVPSGSIRTNGPNGTNDYEVTGNGSPIENCADSATITVTPGTTYVFEAWIDPSQITAGSCFIGIFNTARTSLYQSVSVGSGSASWHATPAWTCPQGVTQIVVTFDSNNCTIANAQVLKFAQPMLTATSAAHGYYISSQNPKIEAFCQILASAVVTNGQKFKISQPMFTLSTYDPSTYISQTSVWIITPKYRGSATITYTDITP